MMIPRRSFFVSAMAAVAGLFGVRQAKASDLVIQTNGLRDVTGMGGIPYDPTVSDRDERGDCLVRVYKLGEDGTFNEIDRETEKAGDTLIWIGLDGKRLWRIWLFGI